MPTGSDYSRSGEAWLASEGYVLLLNKAGLEILQDDLSVTGVCSKGIAKVPKALRRRNMLCFLSAKTGKLTHVARSKVLYPAESGRDKLDLWKVTELSSPVTIAALAKRLDGPQAWRARQSLGGGHLSASAFTAVMKALEVLDPAAYETTAALVDAPAEAEEVEPQNARINWAYQRDAVITAMEVAGIPPQLLKVPAVAPPSLAPETASIFDSIEDMVSIEDLVILQDSDAVGEDWAFLKRQRYAAKTFVNNDTTLTVILANKLDLEAQLGVDLIYYNETYHSVVFVQYKMFRGADGEEGYRPDRQLAAEIVRMDSTAAEFAKIAEDLTCDGYRLGTDPFFLKFCSKLVPGNASGHVPGTYVPLSYWKRLAADPRASGPLKGIVVYDDTFGSRRLTPTLFTQMVGRAWIGTTGLQSGALLSYLKDAIQGKKGVVFAIHSKVPEDGDEDAQDGPPSAPANSAPRRRGNKYPGRMVARKVWSI